MSTKVETSVDPSGNATISAKLPVINGGRSLVSPTQAVKMPIKEQARLWLKDVRERVEMSEDPDPDDLVTLRKELIALFITALQQDSRSSWDFLTEVVQQLTPCASHLSGSPELIHYLERAVQHMDTHKERLFDIHTVDALNKVFPEDMMRIQKPVRTYCGPISPSPTTSPRGSPTRTGPTKSPRMLLPNGKDPYTLERPGDEKKYLPKPLTFGDLSKSLPTVAADLASREAIWQHSAGFTSQAMNVELLSEEELKGSGASSRGSSRLPSEVADLQKLGEEIKITVETEKGQQPPPMTGREAVEYFGKLYHVGKIKHMYFNIAPHRHFRPYDLVAVPQNKANPEHYVFSTFGVLHVYPDQPSENMTLGEWHREAVLYAAVRSIPFFKYFLVRKALRCWHATKKQTDFAEVRDVIKNTLLPNVPCFGAALLQIAKLLHELLTVQFLPDEQDKRYLLPEFENIVNYKNIQAERFLERFFRYGKLIVDTVKEDCFKRLRYCEEQVKHKTVFTKDSLHLQKQKKEQREANLRKAKEETGCLGNFVRLVDQVMLAYLVDLAKRNVSVFVYNVMGAGRDAPREGLFLAHLGFNNKDVLGISPSKEKFLRGMTRVLQEIPGILVMKALPMDENPTITDGESMMDDSATARTRMSQVTATSEKRLRTQDGRTPELNRGKTPTKEEDNLGVATPDLVIKADFPSAEGLVVEGEGFMGQYHPLSKGNLEEKLKNDEEYNRAIKTHTDFLMAGLTEIDDYCKENSWLNEIHQFCKGWNDTSLQEWKGAPAFNIEQRLTEIRSWTERIKMSDRAFTTENGIFHVDCSALQKDLVPKLNSIYKELVTFVAEEASNRGKQFCNEMKVVLQNMRDKKVSMDAFAVYAKQITQYKKNSQQFQQRVEYIKSLFEMVRMNYRQLNPEEEKIEENVWAAWEAFLFNMQEATEFVNMQTPLMTQNLEETFQQLEKEAYHLVEVGTTGKFLSPEENPSAMLSEMRQLRGKFYTVEHKLKECCKWKEMITGNPYNLDFLHKLAIKMDIRQELWKYVELSNHSIIDWKQQLFRKMNVQKAFDKVQEWQGIAFQMKSHLPLGDKVLANWFKVLQDFKQDLPLLHKLASDALKPRHWKEIFVGIGEEYEPGWNVTVAELLDLNLGEHSLLINTIYTGAKSEFALEQKLVKLRKLWQEKNLKLAKHIPDSVYDKDTAGVAPSAHPGGRKVKGMAKFRHEKALANMPKGLNISGDDMFVLIDVEELKYLIDDSQVTLTSMLVSPYLADLRPETEYWSSSLQQAEEILDLWVTCQKKWLYLLKVFEDPDIYRKLGSQSLKFESINAKYKEFIKSVVNDPKVTSIFSKQRGEPGYRRLQGEAIRELLQSLLEGMEQIQKHLENLLEHARSEFPRLYFLSNQEVVDLMGISRNPPALLPCAKKCFAGIKSLTFALPSQMTTMSTALDFVLNAHKLQVTSLTGDMEEAVPLLYKLEANNLATRWLSGLEEGMKSTMATMLQACVQARWEEGSKQSVLLLEELSRYEVSTAHPTQEQTQLSQQIRHSFKHWLLRFPSQCVLVAEAIMWQKAMTKALEHGDRDQLTEIRNQQNSKITQYVNFLRESSVKGGGSSVRKRLQRLLGCLVQQTTQHRDYVEVLLKLGSPTLDSYDWQKIMKFHMDFRSVLRAKTDIKEQPKPEVSSSTPRERRLSHGSSRDSLLSKSDASPKERRASLARLKEKKSEDSMARVKTSVSTGFQFTPCTIQQLGATFLYDHEYLGPSERLVFTPLTERAYLTLTLALRMFHCGTLVGPAATGKSETIKDLAKTLGRHCVTVNCNSELTLPLLNQYLSGMVQSGSWTVFDDTDRLTKGLMSVFAQQIEYLKTALHCLGTSSHNQYGIRGQPRYDKKTFVNKEEGSSSVTHGGRVVRRNSLTTLHSLPSADTKEDLERQNTVPHGYNDEGLSTYFGEAWVPRRERRHSIEKEIEIKESELYKSNKPPSLFVEHATYRPYKPKPDYKVLLHEPVHRPVFLGNVLFNGKLLKANANYGCFMTVNSEGKGFAEIPDNLRLQMRPCALIHPDTHQILEMMLYCNGCSDHKILAKKLGVLFELLKTQLPRKEQYNFSLRTMKTVVTVAHSRLSSNRNLFEDVSANDSETSPSILEDSSTRQEFAIVYAINTTLIPKMADQDDIALLKSLTRDVFPQSVRPKSGVLGYDPDLVSAVQEQMALDNLQATQAHVNKILQLNTAMNHGKGVILIGPAGSGKTTAYQTLARAMNSLHSRPPEPDKDDNKDEIKDKGIAFHSQQKLKFTELKTAREKKHWVTPKLLTENTEKRESNALSRFRKVSKSTSSVAEKLSTLLKDVNKAKRIQYPKIEINTFNPNAFSTEELFGSFQSGLWKDGLLSSILRDCHTQHESARSFSSTFDEKKHKGLVSTPSPVNKWVVLDGCVNPLWAEHMNTMLDSDRLLSLASGEKVALQDTTHLIFEMSHLANASPATISRCELVHCSNETVTWKSIVESWSKAAKQKWIISTNGLKILDDLFSSTIPQTIRYLENDCTYSLTNDMHRSSAIYTQSVPGLQEVMSLLRILSALCDRHFLRADFESAAEGQQKPDDAPPASPAKLTPDYRADSNMRSSRLTGSSRYEDRIPNYTNVVKSMYAFAFIWGFGGQLQERHISKFNKFCRETLYRATYPISLPLSGTVFDYCVEVHHGMMIKWSDRPMEKMRNLPAHYVITPEVERYHYLVDLLLSSHYPVLLVGVPGVGKTALIQNIIQQKHPFSRLPISQGVIPQQLHNSVANYMLEINKRDVLSTHPSTAPLPKPHHLFFIDDLNMAKSDCVTGTQPSLEVLREVMTQRSLYDRHRHVKLDLEGTDFVAACRSPGVAGSGAGESCHILSSRLTRLFTVMTFFMPTAEGMHSLFGKTIQSWLEEFPTYSVEHHHEFAYAMTQGLLEMYNVVKERLRPTPANAHYIFTLRDIARVMEGILMMSPRARPKLKPKPRRKKDKPELGRNKMTISLPALNKPVDRSKLRSQNWAPTAGKDVVGGAPPMMRVIARLWCHEVARTFGDRITAEEDCMWFKRTMEDIVAKYFCTGKAEFREKMSSIKEESGSQFTRSSPVRRITPPPFYKSDSLTPDNELPSTASTVTITEVTTEVTTPFSDYATTMEFVTPLSQGEFTEAATTDVVTPFSTEYDIQSQYQSEFNAPIRAPPPSEDPGSRMSTGSTETETTEESSTEETASSEEDSETETTTSGMQSKMTTTGDESTAMTDYTRTPSGSTGLQLGHLESRTTLYSSIGLLSDSLEDSAANPSQASNLKAPPTPSLKKGGAKKEVKRGVTFKTGLIADRETEAYEGPLLSMEQIKLPNEDLTDIMFTKFIMASYTEAMGLTPDKGYVECSEDILDEALQTCLALYNAGTSQRLDLVFFKEAIQHMARLSRVLAMTNGHSLQLGMSYCTGRATVTRLAAHIAHCKLFEPKPQGDLARNREVLREHMRRCSQTAAIVGKPVVLMIHEELGEECLLDVCSYMVEGTCPGLYTTEELQQIATQMTPGQVQIRKVDKVEQTFNDKFIRRVKQNLHVVIILNYSGSTVYTKHSPMHNLLRKCPSLIHHVISVDLYKPWNHDAYVKVAETWLRDESSRIPVPWSEINTLEQVKAVSSAMAYIHNSSREAVERLYSQYSQAQLKFYTPLTFMEFVHIFKVVSASIAKKEKSKIDKYQAGLEKMNEAFDCIAKYKDRVSELRPRHRAAQELVEGHVKKVEEQKQEFVEARERCKLEEEKIAALIGPLEDMRKQAEAEFDKVNPTYFAALNALMSLSIHDIDEIKSYRAPPEAVIEVVKVICSLFYKPQDWDSGKLLLSGENFFKDLEFYKKDDIPEDIFKKLKVCTADPKFQPSYIAQSSTAAASLCQWIHAVFEYGSIYRTMKPRLRKLMDAEEKLNEAQAILGEKRVEANRIKSELEARIEAHKQAVKKAKTIDREIKMFENKIHEATTLMDNMSMQHRLWQQQLKQSKNKLKTAPGDSLLTAACVCYHGPLDTSTRTELLTNWLGRCHIGNFDPKLKAGKRRKGNTLSAKLDNLLATTLTPSASELSLNVSHREEVNRLHVKHTVTEEEPSILSSPPSVEGKVSPPKEAVVYDTGSVFVMESKLLSNNTDYLVDFDPVLHAGKSKGLVSVRKNFTLEDVLSTFEELSDWKLKNMPINMHAIHNALIMRVCCHNRKHCWPLLVDPDGQAEKWVRMLQDSPNCIKEQAVVIPEDAEISDKSTTTDYTTSDRPIPPSRGTAVTTSDDADTEVSRLNDDTRTETDSNVGSRAQTSVSGGLASRMTSTSDLRPLTSVTNSQENLNIELGESVDRPENNLWVVPGDDPQIDTKLINAVVHGITVLVTHLERRPLDPLFRALLLKQFTVDKDGNKILKIGEMMFYYHPDFCLYLSSSVPLFFKGDGIYDLPIQKVSVINMSISEEGVVDRLLTDLMRVEKSEFEGQRRSIEADMLHHKHELNVEQETVLVKTLNLETPLLEDDTMLETLQTCQKNVNDNQEVLEEGMYLRENLEEKRVHYIPVATHAAMLYDIIKMMGVLCPMYHVTFTVFMKIFCDVIDARNRGKGSQGAPKARAQELIDCTTSAIYKHVSTMMFEQHTNLFSLLLAIERMRATRQLTIEELALFIDGIDGSDVADTIVLDYKPKWLPDKTWMECAVLEANIPAYKGLRASLAKHDQQWQEYFKCPVSLTTPVPGGELGNLSVFKKCLLWRVCCPDRLYEISQAMTLYELGGVVPPADHFNIKTVYTVAKRNLPVVFMLPSGEREERLATGTTGYSIDPVFHIHQLAKDMNMEGKVLVLSCGVPTQMREIKHALEECLHAGYWLVLQNCHLAESWSTELLDIIKSILSATAQPLSRKSQLNEMSDSESPLMINNNETPDGSNVVHPDFRLWLVTKVGEGRLIPGLLIQNGLKVSCERTNNFKSTVGQTRHHVNTLLRKWDGETAEVESQQRYLPALVLLHAILLQRRGYHRSAFSSCYSLSQADLTAAVEAWRILLSTCSDLSGMQEMTSLVYTGHCLDQLDTGIVLAVVRDVLKTEQEINMLPDSSSGVKFLLQQLLGSERGMLGGLEELWELNASHYGLADVSDLELCSLRSRILQRELTHVSGVSESVEMMTGSQKEMESKLATLLTLTGDLPELPQTSRDQMYPLDLCFHYEVEGYRKLISNVQLDITLLQKVIRGEIPSTPELQDIFLSISENQVPKAWLTLTFPTSKPVMSWLNDLKCAVELLTSYLSEVDRPATYNLSAFLRPDRFLQTVLQTHARRNFRDLQAFQLQAEVLPGKAAPSSPPETGVYVSHLHLHHAAWDTVHGILTEAPDTTLPCPMPVVWLKPVTQLELDQHHLKHGVYPCPLYVSWHAGALGTRNLVTKLDMPTLLSPHEWAERRVFLSSSIPDAN